MQSSCNNGLLQSALAQLGLGLPGHKRSGFIGGRMRKTLGSDLFAPSFAFQVFSFGRTDEVAEYIWSNNLIHMLQVTPLVNIQLNMFSRSLCYVDLSLLNRCSKKIRADPRAVVGSRSLCSELMSTPGNRKWRLDLTPTRGNIARNDEFWVFTCSESLCSFFGDFEVE